jgi:hypothetical protein
MEQEKFAKSERSGERRKLPHSGKYKINLSLHAVFVMQ